MRLSRLELTNYRNYKAAAADTDADLILILGPNAAGKTNFLESVYYLSRLKSFRAPDNLLVSEQEDYFKIAGRYNESNLEVVVQTKPRFAKQYKINDNKLKKINWKTFSTVLFVPQDLNLFELGPSPRRKFLDQVLSQVSLGYALDISSLEHVLKQRAALFQQIMERRADASGLDIWNQELSRLSMNIFTMRQQFIDYLNERISRVYQDLSDFNSQLVLEYKSIGVTSGDEFLDRLEGYRDAELRSGQNLFGPHRDDFILKKDGQENLYNSSRGELRSQILALKLLQAEYLDQHQMQPLILLDDVFSELDEIRRNKLITSLVGHQIFITTTEEHHLPKMGDKIKILKIENNQVKTA